MKLFYLNVAQKMPSYAIKSTKELHHKYFTNVYLIPKLLLLNFSIRDAIPVGWGVGCDNLILTSYSTCTAQSASAYILYITDVHKVQV